MPEEAGEKAGGQPKPKPKVWSLEVLLDKVYCTSTTFDDRPLPDEFCLQNNFPTSGLAPVRVGPYSLAGGMERIFTPPVSLGVLPLNPAMVRASAVRWAMEIDQFGPLATFVLGPPAALNNLFNPDDTFGNQGETITIAWNARGPTCTVTRVTTLAPPPPPVILTPAAPLAVVIPYTSPPPGGPPPPGNLLGGPAVYTVQISYRLF